MLLYSGIYNNTCLLACLLGSALDILGEASPCSIQITHTQTHNCGQVLQSLSDYSKAESESMKECKNYQEFASLLPSKCFMKMATRVSVCVCVYPVHTLPLCSLAHFTNHD